MKKLLLIATAIVAVAQFANAQCTPDPMYTSPGFYPDSATGISNACADVMYDEVITVVAIADTVIQSITVSVDSVVITNVTGLPPSLSYACEDASCTIYPGADPSSCIQISGTPTTGEIGSYTMNIEYTAYATVFSMPQSLPLSEDYTLEVEACTSNLLELSKEEKTLVKITDLMGRETTEKPNTPLLYHYSDGTIVKSVSVK